MLSKVKFLTVVWGQKYIERFCALSLPSFLADGNIPQLAKATQLEVVIMTRKEDIVFFECDSKYKRLTKIVSVRFVTIDDLITSGVYGVTLTLAYARPIIASGEDMLNTHFVFMNADFVLANGSLATLVKYINEGRSIVLGPSFRSTAEELEPLLEARVDKKSGVLDIKSREMVELALSNLHPTTFAKVVNQQLVHSSHPNQFYWSVDKHTMLGRCYLIFMLCLKPERLIHNINCYCDYSFIPELCPSGDEVVMDDSDNFFMLELQSRDQESEMLTFGAQSQKHIAQSLQEWTTAEHRRAGGYDIIFHARDIPPEIEITKLEAKKYISEIDKHLGRPLSHKNHKYWVFGVEAWKDRRLESGLSTILPELADYTLSYKETWIRRRHQLSKTLKSFCETVLRVRLVSEWGQSIFSPNWQDHLLLKNALSEIEIRKQKRVLFVRDSEEPLEDLVSLPKDVVVLLSPDDVQYYVSGETPSYDSILVYVRGIDPVETIRIVSKSLSCLSAQGQLYFYLYYGSGPKHENNLSCFLLDFGNLIHNDVTELSIQLVGDRLVNLWRGYLFNSIMRFIGWFRRYGLVSVFFTIPLLVFNLLISALMNVRANYSGKLIGVNRETSSVLVKLKKSRGS